MNELKEQLMQISLRTFEEFAFLMPIPAEDAPPADDLETTITCVSYSGHSKGILYISVTNPMLPVLAQNILAEENTPTEQQQLDALREIANVICGNVLPSLAGGDKIYRLKAPEIVDKIDESYKTDSWCLIDNKLTFDEGIAEIFWFCEKPQE
ncbi:MAG TPA: chemotaxis protein CheX [bacterium]|nr:chemotaxis protein CheX [bacterium]HPN43207.1 chemotaxis protein CheX [bacterium]